MRIEVHDYIDWNSPGTVDPKRGERPREDDGGDIDVGDVPPLLAAAAARTRYRPSDPRLLPASRFENRQASRQEQQLIRAPTDPSERGTRSRTVTRRFAVSCSGWKRRPTAAELYDAIRAHRPTERQKAILETWATEATDDEMLAAWTEAAYTLRELVEALHRAGIERCRAAGALNRWATFP